MPLLPTLAVLTTSVAARTDVIKVRQQATNMRVAATVRGVLQSDGVRGFWRGTVPGLTMVRAPSHTRLAFPRMYDVLSHTKARL